MTNHLYAGIRAAIRSPQARFVETPEGRIVRYADLDPLTGRMANALIALGVTPGDRVAAQVEKSVEALVLYLATVRAGAIYLPLNTAYTPAEIDYFVRDAEPRLVVADPQKAAATAALAEPVGATVATLDAAGGGTLAELAATQSPDFTDAPRAADDLAAILYTSRHHRAFQGCHADPREPRFQRPYAG